MAITLIALGVSMWALDRSYQIEGPAHIRKSPDGLVYIKTDTMLYVHDQDGDLIDVKPVARLGMEKTKGDFWIFNNGDLLLGSKTEKKFCFQRGLETLFRVGSGRQAESYSDDGILERCIAKSNVCMPFGRVNEALKKFGAFSVFVNEVKGDVFITDRTANQLLLFDLNGELKKTSDAIFLYPNGLVIGNDGLLYIANTRQQRISAVNPEYTAFGRVEREFPIVNTVGPSEKVWPIALGQDPNGRWWVINTGRGLRHGDLVIYDESGRFFKQVELPDKADPTGLAVLDNRVLVTDPGLMRVYSIALNGDVQDDFGSMTLKLDSAEKLRAKNSYELFSSLMLSVVLLVAVAAIIIAWKAKRAWMRDKRSRTMKSAGQTDTSPEKSVKIQTDSAASGGGISVPRLSAAEATQPKHKPKDTELVRRFEKTEIFLHWSNGGPFLLLLASGLTILLARFIMFKPGVLLFVRYTHKTVAVTWLVSLGISFFFVGRRLNFKNVREIFTVGSREFSWMLSAARSIYNRNVKVPEVGKFNMGQKINTILVHFYIPAFAGTGVLMWFFGTLLLPWMIHMSLFFIACSSVSGHLYLSFVHPSTRSSLKSVFTGMVPKSYMLHHHVLALPVDMRSGQGGASGDTPPDSSFMKAEIIILIMMLLGGVFGVQAFSHAAKWYLHRGFDSIVSSRELSPVHRIKEIDDCKKCHELTGQISASKCCLCHKAIQQRRESGIGYHGANKMDPCNTCHKEHPVFSESITAVDMTKFNHDVADFKLTGKHGSVKCDKCHKKTKAEDGYHPGAFYTCVPHDSCFACHREKDPHSNSLGEKCESCHKPAGWQGKNLLFSHGSASYRLEGKHQSVQCAKCHIPRRKEVLGSAEFRGVKHDACSDCHKDEHRGEITKSCATCHVPEGWRDKDLKFVHNRDSRFKLEGKHDAVKCRACHNPRQVSGPLGAAPFKLLHDLCTNCHKDQHQGELSKTCEKCHTPRGWHKEALKFDHDRDTEFQSSLHHKKVTCAKCHVPVGKNGRLSTAKFKLKRRCKSCHEGNWVAY